MRRLLAAVAVAAIAAGGAEARQPPPQHAAKAAERRAVAHLRALERRHAVAVRRRAAAKRQQLAAAPVPAQAPAPVVVDTVAPVVDAVVPVVAPAVEQTAPVVTAPLSHVVNVTARDNTLTPSRTLVGAGSVYVEFVNRGEDPHDLHVAQAGHDVESWPVLDGWDGLTTPPLDGRSIVLTGGTYRLYCALHSGMETSLTVAG